MPSKNKNNLKIHRSVDHQNKYYTRLHKLCKFVIALPINSIKYIDQYTMKRHIMVIVGTFPGAIFTWLQLVQIVQIMSNEICKARFVQRLIVIIPPAVRGFILYIQAYSAGLNITVSDSNKRCLQIVQFSYRIHCYLSMQF